MLDSTEAGEPARLFMAEEGEIIPGLEQALEGKSVPSDFKVVIPAEDAYGERDEDLVYEVDRESFEEGEAIEIGMQFETEIDGELQIVTVVGIQGEDVVVDANHELAGKELYFEGKIVDIRPATPEEMEHGHVHGEGCDHDHDFDDDDDDEA
ncbi:MAG: peptidylprolyl isomerase [Planctomycetales bacterium]